jgi:hypothetical protein
MAIVLLCVAAYFFTAGRPPLGISVGMVAVIWLTLALAVDPFE